jgi:hypothetical protein
MLAYHSWTARLQAGAGNDLDFALLGGEIGWNSKKDTIFDGTNSAI